MPERIGQTRRGKYLPDWTFISPAISTTQFLSEQERTISKFNLPGFFILNKGRFLYHRAIYEKPKAKQKTKKVLPCLTYFAKKPGFPVSDKP